VLRCSHHPSGPNTNTQDIIYHIALLHYLQAPTTGSVLLKSKCTHSSRGTISVSIPAPTRGTVSRVSRLPVRIVSNAPTHACFDSTESALKLR
jgi:hypothetical protein